MENENGMKRIRLIRTQLLSKKESIIYKSNKNPLNKWRKHANFDKDIISDMYYPYGKDLREQIYKIMINSPEFR